MKTTNITYGITLALTCGLAANLKAQNIYVGSPNAGTVAEYRLNGSTVNASLIPGLNSPQGMVISGNDLFVGDGTTVGEYNATTGAPINTSLITGIAGFGVTGLAISGNDLFVTADSETVGEYNATTGAPINASLFQDGNGVVSAIVASRSDIFVGTWGYAVGEYTTSGTLVNSALDAGYFNAMAISGNDLYLAGNGLVSELTTSGEVVNATLISSGLGANTTGIAILGNDLYVVNQGVGTDVGTIGEYNATTGAPINASLISGLNAPVDLAIGPVPEPSTIALAGLGATALWLWRRRE